MTPARALATLEAAGVRVCLAPDGTVRLDAARPPPPDVLALARAHRDAIAQLLALPAPQPSDARSRRRMPPSWSDPSIHPARGIACYCCKGRTWWTEMQAPSGWRCHRCHPPVPGLPGGVMEIQT